MVKLLYDISISQRLPLLMLCFSFAVILCSINGEAPELRSKWDLPRPDLFFCDTSQFVFRFDMSTIIENYQIKTFLLSGQNCDVDIGGNEYLKESTVYDEAPPDSREDETKVRQIAFVMEPDFGLLGTSPIYSISDDGVTGTLSFCVLVEVFLPDNSTKVNWREITYSQSTKLKEGIGRRSRHLEETEEENDDDVGLDCMGERGYGAVFENWWNVDEAKQVDAFNVTYNEDDDANNGVGIMVGPANQGEFLRMNTTVSYYLDAYECGDNLEPVPLQQPYQQGDLIRVCIKPDDTAERDGMSMRKIDSMSFNKDGIDNDYYAVIGGQEDFMGFSELTCAPGSPVCYVDTLLKAEWFAEQGFVQVNGIATLQFGTSINRNLHHDRRLQSNGDEVAEELGRFSMNFPVSTFQEALIHHGTSIGTGSSITTKQSILLIVLCFALLTNCTFVFWIRQTRRISRKNNKNDTCHSNISCDTATIVTGGDSLLNKYGRPRSGSRDSQLTIDSNDMDESIMDVIEHNIRHYCEQPYKKSNKPGAIKKKKQKKVSYDDDKNSIDCYYSKQPNDMKASLHKKKKSKRNKKNKRHTP